MSLFSFLFGNAIPTTQSYENKLNSDKQVLSRYTGIASSDEYKRYLSLKEYINSSLYKQEMHAIRSLSFATSSEAQTEKRIKLLAGYKEVKAYLKKGEHADSPYVQEYIELTKKVESPEFAERKRYLKNKNRYKDSEPYRKEQEYKSLEKAENIVWYDKAPKKFAALFAEQHQWEQVFVDEFQGTSLDAARWHTKPFWADAMLKTTYSQAGDRQLTTDGKNIQIGGGTLRIATRRERAEGLMWDGNHGFVKQVFDYTSGTINTASLFRLHYGKVEAKIQLPVLKDTYHAFWLGADAMLPHLNVCKLEGNTLSVAVYGAKGQQVVKKLKFSPNAEQYYYYGLIWDERKIIWTINGKKVFETENLINDPLYLAFASGITGGVEEFRLPVTLNLENVSVYRFKK